MQRRGESGLLAEVNADGVTQHLSQPAACQVPAIPRPHSLGPVALSQLREYRLYPASLLHQRARPRPFLALFGLLVGCEQVQSLLAEPPGEVRAPVVPVGQDPSLCPFEQPFGHREFVDIGRSEAEADDHPGPANPKVRSQAVEGLLVDLVVAESALFGQEPAAVSPSEPTHGDGEGVHQTEERVEADLPAQQVLPQSLFGDPQIGRLTRESGAVHLPQGWEELPVVTPEVGEEVLLGVDAEKLADDLDGQDLRVGKLRVGTALTQLGFSFEPVVNEAEDGDDESAKIHESEDLLLASVGLGATERREVSLFIQPFGETCTRG